LKTSPPAIGVEPWSGGRDYLNFAERPGDASAAFPPEVYRRLCDVKARVDPHDRFVFSHPIRRGHASPLPFRRPEGGDADGIQERPSGVGVL